MLRVPAISALTVLAEVCGGDLQAADTLPVRIAVFAFELNERSAGGSFIAADAADAEQLRLSTQVARRLLAGPAC